MKNRFCKLMSVVLCVALLFATVALPVGYAAYDPSSAGSVSDESHSEKASKKAFYNFADKAISAIVGGINNLIPDPKAWVSADDYVSEGTLAGTETFLTSPAEGAYWSLGYSNASLLEGQDILDGKHYVGGGLKVGDKVATEIYDDLKVRTVAMSDNSGRGTVVFAVVDGFGLPDTDVKAIRLELEDFCKENNIVSLNISTLHQHSAVDTLGLNGNLLKALFLNPMKNVFGKTMENGQNTEYMRNLYNKVEQTVKESVSSMTKGSMYYGTVDMSQYVTDKRDPQMLDSNFERFRFVPADGSKETWFSTSCIHCVGNGASGTEITGDYPYYMEQEINDKYNANFALVLGAEQGTSQDKSTLDTENLSSIEEIKLYGTTLADLLATIDNEEEVSPLLNIKTTEVRLDITNEILTLAGKCGLATNKIIKTGFGKYQEVTEIGYMEIGDNIAVALVPGEAAAELFYGGTASKDVSWTGTDWTLPSLQSTVGDGRSLIVFGLTNDQVGYIIPDNDYMSVIYPNNKSLEVVALGNTAASTLVEAYEELIGSVKTAVQ